MRANCLPPLYTKCINTTHNNRCAQLYWFLLHPHHFNRIANPTTTGGRLWGPDQVSSHLVIVAEAAERLTDRLESLLSMCSAILVRVQLQGQLQCDEKKAGRQAGKQA